MKTDTRPATGNSDDWRYMAAKDVPSTLRVADFFYERYAAGVEAGAPDRVVEFGCGPGSVCLQLAERGVQSVLGMDVNRPVLGFARKRLTDAGYGGCDFACMDAMRTGLADRGAGAVIMQAFLTTLATPEDRTAALVEARRVTHPSGGLYLAVFMQTWYSPKMYRRYVEGEAETGEPGTFWALHPETGERVYMAHHYTERELVDLVQDAGFTVRDFRYAVFTTRTGNQVNGAYVWAA